MMNIAIIDDQIELTEIIYNKVNDLNHNFYKYTSVYEMEQADIHFDLLLLDIDMPDCNGLEYSKVHKDKNIIFITSLSECIKDAFGSNIYGFIEKTDEDERYRDIIKKTIQEIYDQKYITLFVDKRNQDFKLKDITYIQSCGPRALSFVYAGKSYNLRGQTLRKLESQLNNQFIYIDRGTLVNKDSIVEFIGNQLYLKNIAQTFEVSTRRKKDIKNFMREKGNQI